MITAEVLAAIEAAAARVATEAPAPDPEALRRSLDVLAPLTAAAHRAGGASA
ncbi:MAG: hypothetical protein WCF36_04750 [Candidatus Nanopelagicales bacterium]